MKRFITSILCLCLAGISFSQCYDSNLQKGKNYYNSRDYSTAKDYFTAGLSCDDIPSNGSDILNEWIQKCNDKLTTLSVSQSYLSFSATGNGKQYVTIYTNAASWSASANNYWINTARSGNQLTIYCDNNTLTSSRNGIVTITAAGGKTCKITISQNAASTSSSTNNSTSSTNNSSSATTLSVSPESYTFPASGGTKSFYITSNKKWEREYGISFASSVTNYSNYVQVTVPANNGTYRTDFFYVKAGDKKIKVTINQNGGTNNTSSSTRLTLSPSTLSFTSVGGSYNSKTVSVSGTGTFSASVASTSYSWIHITTSQGKITVYCDKNYSTSSRYGSINVNHNDKYEQSISVAQSGVSSSSNNSSSYNSKANYHQGIYDSWYNARYYDIGEFNIDWLSLGLGTGTDLFQIRADAFRFRLFAFEANLCTFFWGVGNGLSWQPSLGFYVPIRSSCHSFGFRMGPSCSIPSGDWWFNMEASWRHDYDWLWGGELYVRYDQAGINIGYIVNFRTGF